MPVFNDVSDFPWAIPELDEAFRLGLVHGAGDGSLCGKRPDGWSDDLWQMYRVQKVQTACMVVRAAQPWAPVAKMYRPRLVRLWGAGVGTASPVSLPDGSTALLTAAHVLLDVKSQPTAGFAQRVADLMQNINWPLPFSILRMSQQHDLALTTCPWPLDPISIGDEPNEGDWLLAFGCGGGQVAREIPIMAGPLTTGAVNQVSQYENADAATVQAGDSGGPTLDMGGHIVRVISNSQPGGSMTLTMPTQAIRDFIAGVAP